MSIISRILILIAATLLLVASVEIFNGVQLRRDRLQELGNDTVQLARIAELDVTRILDGSHQLLSTLAKLPVENGWDKRACAVVEATASNDFEYDHIVGVDRNGVIQCSSSGETFVGTKTPDADLIDRVVTTGGFSVGSFGTGRLSGNEVLRVGYPVIDAAGAVTGAVYAGINLTWLNTALSQWKLGEQAAIYVTDRNGIVIGSYPNSTGIGKAIAENLRAFLTASAMGVTEQKKASGEVELYGYVPVTGGPSDGLGVFVGRDPKSEIDAINRTIWMSIAATLVALFLAAFIAVVYVRRFLARPFNDLITSADHWRVGDWGARAIAQSGIPEFDQLAANFEAMAAAVNDREKALLFTNLFLKMEMENSQDAILVVNHAGQIQLSNRLFAEMWRIPPALVEAGVDEPILAAAVTQVKDPDHFIARVRHLHEHIEERGEDQLALKDGRIIDRYSAPMKSPDGQYLGRIWFFRDVTEKRQAEMVLREERDFTAALLNTLPGLFVLFDDQGRIVRWNENLSGVTGLTNEQLSDADAFSLIAEDQDRDAARRKLVELFEVDHTELEFSIRSKNGELRRISWSGRPIRRDGRLKAVAIGIDVTEARAAAERLQASEEALAEAQTIARVGSWEIDQRTGRVTWSPEVFRIFGVDPQTYIPSVQSTLERTHPDDRGTLEKAYRDALASLSETQNSEVLSIDHRIIMDDGSVKFVHERGRMIYDEKGGLGRAIGTVQDITERKNVEDALTHERDFSTAIIDGLPGVFFVLDSNGKNVRINANLAQVTGLSKDELIGMDALQNVPSDDHALVLSKMREGFRGGHGELEIGVLHHPTGAIRRYFISARGIKLDDGPGILGVGIDVTEARAATVKLKESEERFRAVSDSAQDAIIIIDAADRITYWNASAERIFGYRVEEAIGKPIHKWLAPQRFRERAAAGMQAFAAQGHGDILGKTLEFSAIRKDGTEIPIELSIAGMRVGKEWHAVGTLRDISERKRIEAQLVYTARYDFLTDLPNRAVFVEMLEKAIASAKRENKFFAVLYLDLDHFKDVNDTLGHPVGDKLLQLVAQRLEDSIRETDAVARFGGDEFALINAGLEEAADAVILADRVLSALSDPFSIDGTEIRSGASIGIAVYGADAPDAETLLSHADVALYRAKADGRGTYRYFTEAMDMEVHARVTLAAELRTAITSGQLFLVYQPQVNVDSGRIIGLEALVRWNHPTKGVIQPSVFVPIAEKSGLIGTLGQWVVREACRQARIWLDAGVSPPLVAVNVSSLQFKTPFELEKTILECLAETGVPAGHLELELTESGFMAVSREHSGVLQRLREIGVRLAIDDFGTGYSSLEYLGRIPVNRVKIAQTFIADVTSNSHHRTIVKAAISMAHELGLDVIVEGVETADQLELVRSWNGKKVQGFYFSKPLAPREMTSLLRLGKIGASRPVLVEAVAV